MPSFWVKGEMQGGKLGRYVDFPLQEMFALVRVGRSG